LINVLQILKPSKKVLADNFNQIKCHLSALKESTKCYSVQNVYLKANRYELKAMLSCQL